MVPTGQTFFQGDTMKTTSTMSRIHIGGSEPIIKKEDASTKQNESVCL